MGADDLNYGRNLLAGKSEALKKSGHFFERVSHIVPFGQCDTVFGTMADEDANVVQPGRGVEDVIVERFVLRELLREFVETRLMAELIGRIGLGADVLGNSVAVVGFWHGQMSDVGEY